jgi:hypothetical protein
MTVAVNTCEDAYDVFTQSFYAVRTACCMCVVHIHVTHAHEPLMLGVEPGVWCLGLLL